MTVQEEIELTKKQIITLFNWQQTIYTRENIFNSDIPYQDICHVSKYLIKRIEELGEKVRQLEKL